MVIRLWIYLLVISCAFSLWAGRLFVSTTGSDSTGDGSISNPYLTLDKASEEATPGDTIYLRGGTYFCTDIDSRHELTGTNGTASHPIVVRPYQNETVILDGTGYNLANNDGLLRIKVDYYVVEGLTICHSSQRGIHLSGSHHLTIRNCTVYDIYLRGIGGSGEYLTIENNHVHHCSMINQNGSGEYWTGGIQTIGAWDTGENSRHIIIRNNHVHDCWGESILITYSEDVLIDGNQIENGYAVYVYITKARNVTICNNYIFATDSSYNWTVHNYPANGITLGNEKSSSTTFPAIDSILIYNNIIAGCGKGITYFQDSHNTNPLNSYSRIWIYNNVIAQPVYRAIRFSEVGPGYNQPFGCELRNNIIGKGEHISSFGNPEAWSFSHNNWVDSLPDFAAEPHSFSGDPRFQSPIVGGDPEGYQLRNSSPCLAAGTPIARVSSDFWGSSRHPVAPCIGVHEVPSLVLNLTAFLQGPYLSTADTMRCTYSQNGWLPQQQPYDGAPWDYPGEESAPSYLHGIVDWLLVGLRSSPTDTSGEIRHAALLKSNGQIVGTSGVAPLAFPNQNEGDYTVVVYHRNHLPVCSAQPIHLPLTGVAEYDFSTSDGQAYSTGPSAQIFLGNQRWGLLAGDGNSDGAVDALDFNEVWLPQQGSGSSYQLKGDFNLDGTVDATDRNGYWLPNNGSARQFP